MALTQALETSLEEAKPSAYEMQRKNEKAAREATFAALHALRNLRKERGKKESSQHRHFHQNVHSHQMHLDLRTMKAAQSVVSDVCCLPVAFHRRCGDEHPGVAALPSHHQPSTGALFQQAEGAVGG